MVILPPTIIYLVGSKPYDISDNDIVEFDQWKQQMGTQGKNLNAEGDVVFEVALLLDPLTIFCFGMDNVGSLPFTLR